MFISINFIYYPWSFPWRNGLKFCMMKMKGFIHYINQRDVSVFLGFLRLALGFRSSFGSEVQFLHNLNPVWFICGWTCWFHYVHATLFLDSQQFICVNLLHQSHLTEWQFETFTLTVQGHRFIGRGFSSRVTRLVCGTRWDKKWWRWWCGEFV